MPQSHTSSKYKLTINEGKEAGKRQLPAADTQEGKERGGRVCLHLSDNHRKMWLKFNLVETRPAPNAHSNHTREVKCFRRGAPLQGTSPPPEQERNEIKLVVQAGLPSPTKDQTQQECLLPVRTINIKLARVQVRCIHSFYRRMYIYIYIYRFSEARRTKYFLYPFPNTTHMMGRGRRKRQHVRAHQHERKETFLFTSPKPSQISFCVPRNTTPKEKNILKNKKRKKLGREK